jgi:hypothetical protein
MNGEKSEGDWKVKMDTLILVVTTETEREMRGRERKSQTHDEDKIQWVFFLIF